MKNLKDLVRPNIWALKPYSSARDEYKGFEASVFLDANESAYNNGINRYPDPLQLKVKTQLAEIKGVDAENIFLGNGSDEAIDLVYRVFCEPGKDNVVAISPTYGMYEVCADINNVEYRSVSLSSEFYLKSQDILDATDNNTKAIFVCSPNNPTGNAFPTEQIDYILQNFEGIVVVDEAYIDYSPFDSYRFRLKDFPNLIVLQTFSKAWGAAALRLGIAFASKQIIDLYNKVKYPYNVNFLTQQRALEVMAGKDDVARQISETVRERERLSKKLSSLACVKHVFTSDANFILARVDDACEKYDTLVRKGIIVRNRHRVQLCQDCLRITIGLPEENDILIAELEKI